MPAPNLQKVPIMIANGLEQGRDDYVDAGENFARFENMYLLKQGRGVKRKGFERLALQDQDGNTVNELRGCFSTGKELALIGRRYLYTHNETWGRIVNRGPVSPFVVKQADVFRNDYNNVGADCATVNGYTMYASHRQRGVAGALNNSIDITIVADDGSVVVSKSYDEDQVLGSAPRVAAVGNHLVCIFADGLSTPANLRRVSWDTSSPTVATPTTTTTITADLYLSYGRRTYDLVRLETGEGALVYIDDTSQNLNYILLSTALASSATGTISLDAPYSRVALADNTADNFVCVLAVADGGDGSADVMAYAATRGGFAVQWGGVTLDTGSSIPLDLFDNVGCAFGNGRMACTWTRYRSLNNALPGETYMVTRDLRAVDGLDVGTSNDVDNAIPYSRPFYLDGEFYVAGHTAVTTNVWDNTAIHEVGGTKLISAPYEANIVWQIPSRSVSEGHWRDSSEATWAVVAASFDVGTAGLGGGGGSASASIVGGGNNVIVGANNFRFMAPTVALAVFDNLVKYNHSEVTLDTSALPNAIGMGDGSAFIGGGLPCWYDGELCHELHFINPPVFLSCEQRNDANSPGLSDASVESTYQWVGILYQPDGMGRIHRSVPSPPVTTTFAVADTDETARMTYKTLPATNRWYTRSWSWWVYRSSDDLLYRRAMEPLQGVGVTQFDDYGQVSISEDDADALAALPLYTTGNGGQAPLETVAPNACNAAVVAGGRLWLGDFARRVRVQYSKPFAPGTATEDPVAPDFNEGFGYVAPEGESVRMLAELDGATIVGTDENIYTVVGNGPNDAGQQNDFSGLRQVQSDTGCVSQRSVVRFPDGILFQGPRGIHMLGRDLSVSFIGISVVDETDAYPVITSAVLVEDQGQVRFTCTNTAGDDGIILVYDYVWGAWFKWTPKDASGNPVVAVGACLHDDRYILVEADGTIWRQSTSSYYDDTTQYVVQRLRTAHVQSGGHGGHQKVVAILPTLRREDHHALNVDLFKDFASSSSETHSLSEAQVSRFDAPAERMRPHVKPSSRVRRCSAMAVELSDAASDSTTTGAGFSVSGLLFFIEPRGNAARIPKQARL